ncbi:MAG: glycosyltransferase family 2 protein [Planctomycetia bacterium]|nr:glycosyltransferase family 2 protein [Planctomycetia bacterium]
MIVVVPMAGGDDAFKERGFSYCKSLIEIHGKPLVEHAWACLRPLAPEKFVFVVRKEDVLRSHLHSVLHLLDPASAVVRAEGPTAGAACTALLAIEHIRPEAELIVSNGDQLFDCDLAAVIADFRSRSLDAGTIVFDSVHPRWSFVRVGNDGLVSEAAEKRPISRDATAGFYYFRRGADFLRAATDMIRKDAHVNGLFYVCPAFNEMILTGAKIGVHRIPREAYISLATPQNIDEYEQRTARASAGDRNHDEDRADHA